MNSVYENVSGGTATEWPEDNLLSDQVLEALKEDASESCILCQLDDLGEEE